jgi:4-amino-4-deoxy-L-arabinose transferase-like glycosyltransferase
MIALTASRSSLLVMEEAVLASTSVVCFAPRRRSRNYRFGACVLRRYAVCAWLIIALATLNCFSHLSSSVVSDLDEARYGVASGEMLKDHSALVATYAGQPEYWNLKPPLGYWLQELSYLAFGPTVFAMRLPAALCALATIALTMHIAKLWYGRRLALIAGLLLTTCFGLVNYHGFRIGDLDSCLTLIMLIGVTQSPKLVSSGSARLIWAGMFGLGFLLKSFAILPFAATTMLYLAWSGEWRRSRLADWIPATSLLASIILVWMIARSWADHSTYFVTRMVREDLIGRASRPIDLGVYKPWAYLGVLLDRFSPWPMFILVSLVLQKQGHVAARAEHSRIVWLWALVPLIAFSLARTQHHWYLDPAYPAWSILAAGAALNLIALSSDRGRQCVIGLMIVGMLFCETRVLFRAWRTDRRPPEQAFLLALRDSLHAPVGTILRVKFPLSHSERFILQVVDGFQIEEPVAAPLAVDNGHAFVGQRLLLVRDHPSKDADPQDSLGTLLAQGAGYRVLADASLDAAD